MKTKSNGSKTKLPRVYETRTTAIISAVLDEYGYDTEQQLWKAPRTPQNCWARWIVWHFMREIGMTYTMIAEYTGHDHSTILHGVNRLETDMDLNSSDVLGETFANVKKALL